MSSEQKNNDMRTTTIKVDSESDGNGGSEKCFLLCAWASSNTILSSDSDAIEVSRSVFKVGRDNSAHLTIVESEAPSISRIHFVLEKKGNGFWIKDLSKNGTWLNGMRLPEAEHCRLNDNDVIRLGQLVMVYTKSENQFGKVHDELGIAGKFYALPILTRVFRVLATCRSQTEARVPCIIGPTGVGKTAIAKYIATLESDNSKKKGKFVAHDCGSFVNDEEAISRLFGDTIYAHAGRKKNEPTIGLVEEAIDGHLFLDEIHNLPMRAQASLLGFATTGTFRRAGETKSEKSNARLIFASNDYRLLKHDLRARCREIHVPPLCERKADIPEIFLHIVANVKIDWKNIGKKPKQINIAQEINQHMEAQHIELLCIDAFPDTNVRGIQTIVDEIVGYMVTGKNGRQAVDESFKKLKASMKEPRHHLPSDEKSGAVLLPGGKTVILEGNTTAEKKERFNAMCSLDILKIYKKNKFKLSDAANEFGVDRGSFRRWICDRFEADSVGLGSQLKQKYAEIRDEHKRFKSIEKNVLIDKLFESQMDLVAAAGFFQISASNFIRWTSDRLELHVDRNSTKDNWLDEISRMYPHR